MSDVKKIMKLTFHGAAGDVTGANFLCEVDSGKFLVDCGMFQGSPHATERNRDPFPYETQTINALLITHAHQDHIGRIPKLVRDGFRGPIYSTRPTRELAEIMLYDTLGILEDDARDTGIPAIFEKRDIEQAMSQWREVNYKQKSEIVPGVTAIFRDAGHVLGSAMIEIDYGNSQILFTGDLGNTPTPLLRDIAETPGMEYLVMESVYGDRDHDKSEPRVKLLEHVIEETHTRGGTLMIPAFSLERTQELLYELNNLVEHNKIPRMPIYLDSPLAIKVTEVYRNSTEFFNEHTKKIIHEGDDIFDFPGLKMTSEVEESKRINTAPSPKIIIAGSGMMNGGRILHHAMHFLSDPKNTLLFVGYQAAGTLGRIIQDGKKKIKIFRQIVPVRAQIETIEGYSGHAGSHDLIDFVDSRKETLKHVFCVMGEPKSAMFLAQRLHDYVGVTASAPQAGESVELEF